MLTPKIWKVCVIGDKSVGKTSLVRRFVFDTFGDDDGGTVESRAFKKRVGDVLLMIWDVSVYEEHVDRILAGAKAVIIMGDITREETYETMEELAKFLNGNKTKKIFVGNKNDLKYMAQFWKKELEKLSMKFKVPYTFTSAKTGENVEEVFRMIMN